MSMINRHPQFANDAEHRAWLESELKKGLESGVSERNLKQIHMEQRKRRAAA